MDLNIVDEVLHQESLLNGGIMQICSLQRDEELGSILGGRTNQETWEICPGEKGVSRTG